MKVKAACALFLFLALSGCESFLTPEPRSTLVQDNFYQTADHARSAVNGIYAFLRPPYNATGTYGETPYAMLELSTGQYRTGVREARFALESEQLNVSAESPYVSQWWTSSYQGIEAANLALANVPEIEMDEAEKSRLLGEARFLRAYYYFNLVRLFGDVPLKTTATEGPSDGDLPASSVEEIYNEVIVPDLQAAEEAGLPGTSSEGRVSEGAVKSLLAKVYLTMTGSSLGQTDMYALARDKAQEVIDGGYYDLFQTDEAATWFDKLNSPGYDNLQEHIFMANYAPNIADAYVPRYLLPKEAADLTVGIEFSGLYVTDEFLNSYEDEDLRAENHGFFYESVKANDQTYTFPWMPYKFFDENLIEGASQSSKNFPLLRYADILLVYAEAQNEAEGGPNGTAYDAINQVRERAGLPALSGLSQEEFRHAVWKERSWELTGEDKVWFTMVRTMKVYDAANDRFVDFVGYEPPSTSATLSERNYYFPIPLRELQTNDNLDQNPGY